MARRMSSAEQVRRRSVTSLFREECVGTLFSFSPSLPTDTYEYQLYDTSTFVLYCITAVVLLPSVSYQIDRQPDDEQYCSLL